MEVHNIDSLLTETSNKNLSSQNTIQKEIDVKDHSNDEVNNEINQSLEEKQNNENEKEYSDEENITKDKKQNENNLDEYGNPVSGSRMYSEEEVQNMIRERVSRIKSVQPEVKKENKPSISTESNEDESWQNELINLMDRHWEEKQRESQVQQWKHKEMQRQTEFESKFTTGMSKYPDFHKVIAGKNITDPMMLGIRNLDNPAAFIYGASKLHPAELERISGIEDPYIQASEMGKLHERMVKERKMKSSAPNPVEIQKGDLGLKNPSTLSTNINSIEYQSNLTSRINEYAKQKRR
jgi:hypothetical protein